ncbi:DMT family transporter [Thermodesulfobium acidiphilum]|uniref:DMT family transporter n=1 Tax=Thermodesulfobium acidiphilum TaxID=1794699 RepID=UPI0022774301|nr:EamA family transporter [Thermodesulfobium acidiphilum]
MIGYIFTIGAASLWGFGGCVAKFAFNKSIDPLLFVKIRLVMSFSILFIYLYFFNRKHILIDKSDILYFLILGIFGMSTMQLFYLMAIKYTNVSTAVFLQYTSPVLMALYLYFFEKNLISIPKVMAISLSLIGGACFAANMAETSLKFQGFFYGILAALGMAFISVYGRKSLKKYSPLTLILYSSGFAAIFINIITPFDITIFSLSKSTWLILVYFSIFSTLIPYFLYFKGVSIISPTNAGITACLEPFIASIVAFFWLKENLTTLQIIGGILIVSGVITLQKFDRLP